MKNLQLENYNYSVPDNLIAQYPCKKRENSKLLIYNNSTKQKYHTNFNKICEQIPAGSLLIVNDTKVFKARILSHKKSGAKIEIFVLKVLSLTKNSCIIEALIKGANKIKEQDSLILGHNILATITTKSAISLATINMSKEKFLLWLEENAHIPLPPYIKRQDEDADVLRYQTVYGENSGSVAAPTAGLHFSDDLIKKLKSKDVTIKTITLHVGLGTFLPVKSENIKDHNMHCEEYKIPKDTYQAICKNLKNKSPIIAVGTTTLRCLESFKLLTQDKQTESFLEKWQTTDLFIHPQKDQESTYNPWALNGIVTNFHQPKSTLFMLICALLGTKQAKSLYQEALKKITVCLVMEIVV